MSRSFKVSLAESADCDLKPLNEDERRDVIRKLARLEDRDLWDLSALDWERGPLGAWVLLLRGSWGFLCQLDRGMPQLPDNLEPAKLTVIRIKSREYVPILLHRAP